ncbi:peptide ABC transporter substrate-binding protein [Litchfieldia alkalitelluris]|uniref:peptide ABC transporter substrate-binding protein n=1 Tax=Litchfieldia alkalitelluris TaxID=304268 RepID=UPI0009964F84|nr:peptide ABC transporter substrate-binding protein [Litchfieldia alkalitelluris]
MLYIGKRLIVFSLALILVACDQEADAKKSLAEIYSLALNSIMERDTGLNGGMDFIAIDMSNFDELDQRDRKQIVTFFEDTYKTEVMISTFEDLQEKGLYNEETSILDGILLRIEKVDFKFNNEIVFEGSKYRSGLGSIGVEVIVYFDHNQWQVKEIKETWIS